MARRLRLVVPLSPAERAACDDLRARAGLQDDAALGRLALWRLAEHYDLGLPLDLFPCTPRARRHGRRAERPAPPEAQAGIRPARRTRPKPDPVTPKTVGS